MKKSITIIGGGIAGLSAGCYSQMNGYRTQIFEMHNKPGGVCTTWKRKGYKIDGCVHWLTGSSPGNVFYRLWEEVGVVQGRTLVDHEEYARVEGKDGKVFIVYSDINRLEQHMKELAPEDKDVIEEFTNGIRKIIHFPMPVEKEPDLYTPIDGLKLMLKMLPFFNFLRKWGKTTIQDVAQRFKNPFLRQAFPYVFNLQNPPDFPMMAVLIVLAWMNQKTAGYPVGGSLEFARAIERRYLGLGGKIHYKSRVIKILVENDRVVGVRLADGSEHRSDIVISAADGRTTIFDMLDGKYINKKIQGYYDKLPLYPPLIYIGLGVARSFEEIPQTVTGIDYPLNKPIIIGGRERKRLSVAIYNFDPTLAPEGKTFVKVMFPSDYEYWKKLKQDPKRYKAEKEHIVDQVIASLDQRFPGLAAQVEMRDVATPMTFERYTGNWQGSFQGWLETTENLRMRMGKTLPGLKNFYMAGQWVEPGGSVPVATMSGRNVTQIICKQDKKKFVTSTP
ncbi:MAG: phytoene desaturase family protein [Candidatus Hodarchaeales archaeon]|jgi:phytoene dehydrogenase-like protein